MTHAARLLLLLPLTPIALGQAIPAARGPAFYTGFKLPDVSGTMHYSVTVSERISLGSNSSTTYGDSTNIGGNIGYLSSSPTQPFSAIYSGAYLYTTSRNYPSQVTQNLSLSKILERGRWKFIVADSVRYLPTSPITGISGIPGLGNTSVPPVTGGAPGILTNYAQRVTNSVSGTADRAITGSTSLSGTGSYAIIRYINVPNGSSTDDNAFTGTADVNHRFDARTSGGLRYSYTDFSYVSVSYGITAQTVGVTFSRSLSRRSTFTAFVGPQHIVSSSTLIPSRTSVSTNEALTYRMQNMVADLTFSHSTGSGSGLITGVSSTALHGTLSRQLGRAYHVGVNGGYQKTTSLQLGAYGAESLHFSVQANRKLTEYLSAYVSYSAQHQINSGNFVPNLALSGLIQTMSFGLTYAPAGFHVGH